MIPRKTGQETTLLESVPHGGILWIIIIRAWL